MNIFFDHQCYWETFGGVSRYFTEILKTDVSDVQYELALKYSNNEYLKELNFPVKSFLKNWNIPKKQYFISAVNKPNTIFRVKHTDAKIVHLTHYDPYLFKYLKNKIIVSTMHDLNFFAIPQFYKKRTELLKKWQTATAQKSDKIITISENSKQDLIKFLNIPESKITVIYHGVNSIFKKDCSQRIIEKPYILFVGKRYGYKNFSTVLKSFANLKDKFKDLILVCTGNTFSNDEIKIITDYKILDRVVQMMVAEKELINLYSNALFFVFPSFYEGFGFPLLEAMGCECPVICSDASCFPEIAGNAAMYFNPNSVDELTEKMTSLIISENVRNQLIYNGMNRVKYFSWDVSREKHLEFYKTIE